jgi:ribosome-binding ATPase YchF (GTP1/OBG family)
MDVGIVGPPGAGRTTVFRALLAHRAPRQAGARSARAGVGTIHVQDPRLDRLAERFRPRKVTPVEIHVHDLCPSLEPSFPKEEIEAMKRLDQLLVVVPAFADPSPEASVAALVGLLEELCLEDLAVVERRLKFASRDRLEDRVREALAAAEGALAAARPIESALEPGLCQVLGGSGLVTNRPMIALRNVAEDRAGAPAPPALVERAAALGLPVLSLCASLEAEMAELPVEDRPELLAEYGIEEAAGAAVTRALLERADLISFFTLGDEECRAWAVARGATARAAAGKVHSDMERGFIRAEVIAFEELDQLAGGLTEAKKVGKLRIEGKDYAVQDGDVVHVRFNV